MASERSKWGWLAAGVLLLACAHMERYDLPGVHLEDLGAGGWICVLWFFIQLGQGRLGPRARVIAIATTALVFGAGLALYLIR